MPALVALGVCGGEVGQVVLAAGGNFDEVVDLVGSELVADVADASVSIEDALPERLLRPPLSPSRSLRLLVAHGFGLCAVQ